MKKKWGGGGGGRGWLIYFFLLKVGGVLERQAYLKGGGLNRRFMLPVQCL